MKAAKKCEESHLQPESQSDSAHKPPVLAQLLQRVLPVLGERDNAQVEGQQAGDTQQAVECGSQVRPVARTFRPPHSTCLVFVGRGHCIHVLYDLHGARAVCGCGGRDLYGLQGAQCD